MKVKFDHVVNALVLISSLAALATSARSFEAMRAQRHQLEELSPKAGSVFSLAGQDWASSRVTLVAVLSRGCHACTDSVPFYVTLLTVPPVVVVTGVEHTVVNPCPSACTPSVQKNSRSNATNRRMSPPVIP